MKLQASKLAKAAPLFAALGDPVRLAMVAQLSRGGPLPTIRLQQATAVSRQAVTKHLQLLETVGIVTSQRVGRDRQWQIAAQRLAAVRSVLDEISAQWDATLERLRQFVEDDPGKRGT